MEIGWPCVASIHLWQAALALTSLTTLGARQRRQRRLGELPTRFCCDAEIDRFRWSIFFRYLS